MTLNTYTTKTLWRTLALEKEQVTLRARQGDDTEAAYEDYTLYHVQTGASSAREEATGGVLFNGLRRRYFVAWQDDLDQAGAPRPKVGDLMVRASDSTEWVIQSVSNGILTNVWNCECLERA